MLSNILLVIGFVFIFLSLISCAVMFSSIMKKYKLYSIAVICPFVYLEKFLYEKEKNKFKLYPFISFFISLIIGILLLICSRININI